jgi:16S rRNA (cytosine967-C5)-methyltransferase
LTTSAFAQGLPLWQMLQQTARLVQAVREGQSLSALLPRVDTSLRAGVQALTFDVLRRLGRAQALRERLAPRRPPPAVDALLCSALALADPESAVRYTPHTLVSQAVEAARRQRNTQAHAAFVNACLRQAQREQDIWQQALREQPTARWNHPLWWIERVQRDYPDHWPQILASADHAAPMTLRVNRLHHTPATYLQLLQARDMSAAVVGEQGLQLSQAMPVHDLPGFAQGWVSVQDAAAQIAAPLLLQDLSRPRPWRVLDACAAPGGKTGHLLEHAPDAHVLALEVDAQRSHRIHDNLERLGLRARIRTADAGRPGSWWDGQAFDAILLDAPCSASGIVRRHPDVRWLRRPDDIERLADLQQQLLQALWPLLAPGGRLLYCTCSVFKAEGQAQVQAFLARNTEAVLLPSPGHLLPRPAVQASALADNPLGEHDGFYYALLARQP